LEPFALADTAHPSHRDEDVPTTAVRSSGRPRVLWGLALVGVLVLALAVGTQWWGGGAQNARLTGPVDEAPSPEDRDERASQLLNDLEQDLLRGHAAGAASWAGGDSAAERELRELTAAVSRVGLKTLDLRYVAAVSDQQDEVGRALEQDDFVAEVDLTWQLREFDPVPASLEVPVVLRDDGERTWFVTARDQPADRAPIWFNDRVTVERPSPRVMLVQSDAAGRTPLGSVVGSGVRTVRDALPGWDGRVVVEVPGSPERFARATGLASSSARGIAAVTTSSAVADLDGGPERVVVNARVYAPLGGVGQRIVMAHELTHVAVGAASSSMPLWLSEGYADYVALRRSEVSVRVLAAQIRSLVRREGPPRALPGPDEFDGGNADVGAWYEASWLAARLIAATYGEDALDGFYRRADADGGTDRAFRELGTTQRAFTAAWRDELETLAR
jgi:hypothetical protein